MSPMLLVYLIFLGGLTSCSAVRHVININSTNTVRFSSIAWNPLAGHFVAGSTKGPAVYAIPDAGRVKCIISEPSFNRSNASVNAVAVDNTRRRLIVAYSSPSFVAVYDLKSYTKIFTVPLPELGGPAGGVAVDEESGEMFVSSTAKGVVLKLGSEGDKPKVISEFEISDDAGFGGLIHTDHGYVIVAQPTTGIIFKVNSEDVSKEVSFKHGIANTLPTGGHAIVMVTNTSVVLATNETLNYIKSDNTWDRGKFDDGFDSRKHCTNVAVARREEATYVLVKSPEGWRIEEVKFVYGMWITICLWACLIVVPFGLFMGSCLLIFNIRVNSETNGNG